MNKFKINCPSCGKQFSAENDVRNYLKVKEALFRDEIKVKDRLNESKILTPDSESSVNITIVNIR